jgi:cytoskeleton protein RodZ
VAAPAVRSPTATALPDATSVTPASPERATEDAAGTLAGGAPGAATGAPSPDSEPSDPALAVRPAAGSGQTAPTPEMPATGRASATPAGDASGGSPVAALAPAPSAEPDRAPVDPARAAVAAILKAAGAGAARVWEPANTDARVILRAREPAWIQVASRSGDYSFTRTLEPGEAVLVPNRPDLALWTGNAAGLELIVDGAPVSLPGGRLVRRDVSLDPERLRAASQPPR